MGSLTGRLPAEPTPRCALHSMEALLHVPRHVRYLVLPALIYLVASR